MAMSERWKDSMEATHQPTPLSVASDQASAFLRATGASVLGNLPMLVLLLIPQLMRSRAGSEPVMAVGVLLYFALVLVMIVIAPVLSAWAAPIGETWRPATARRTTATIRKALPKAYWFRVGEFFGLFLLAQGAGSFMTWMIPYIWENPEFKANPEANQWVIDYQNYSLQAMTIYLMSCVASGWYGTRVRDLSNRLGDT